ncbi:MAG: outer membrane beta-barrel protein [Bacteroidales bacterium]|nr:outer membrane beta-barrel protein [Bacteroidales bacterium]
MNSVRLKAISVKAPRPVYSMDGEIVSYNVANDRTINGLTAMDAIKNSPTVEVDEEGNITMRGSEKVQVWFNGYPTGMNGASLKAFFESLPAGAIERIEVIKNPSGKYMVEDVSHIINIVTSSKLRRSELLMFGASASNRPYFSPWASYLLKNDRLTMNLYANFGNTNSYANEHGYSIFLRDNGTSVDTSQRNTYRDTSGGHQINSSLWFNLSYVVDSATDISVMSMYTFQRQLAAISNYNYEYWHYYPDSLHYLYSNRTNRTGYNGSGFTNISFKHRFRKKGHNISFGLSSNYSNKWNDITLTRDYTPLSGLLSPVIADYSKLQGKSAGRLSLSLSANYTLPLGENDELSLRATGSPINRHTNTTNNYYADLAVNPELFNISDSLRNGTVYSNSPSTSLNLSWRHQWKRLTMSIDLWGQSKRLRSEYRKFFPDSSTYHFLTVEPSLNLTLRTKSMHYLRFKYNLAFTNPSASNLTASRTYGEDSYSIGNPNIKSSHTHKFNLSWNKYFSGGSSIGIESYANFTADGIESVTETTGEPDLWLGRILQYTIPYNVGQSHKIGIESNATWRPASYFNIRLYANLYNDGYSIDYPTGTQSDNNTSCNFRISTTTKIAKRVNINVSGSYNSPQMMLFGEKQSSFNLSLSVSGTFFDDRLSAYVKVTDPFNWNHSQNWTYAPMYQSYNSHHNDNRYITLGISWRFGKAELEWQARKGASAD